MPDEVTPGDIAPDELAPDAPRERQVLRLPASKLDALREWAVDGTGLTAAARVRDPDGRLALVRNGWSDGWILPGGAVEPGEEPAAAARREVREETGLDATVGDPLVVFDQAYVAADDPTTGDEELDSNAAGELPTPSAGRAAEFTARYVVYSATAAGEIPDATELGVTGGEIEAARWFESPPGDLHDGDLLRPYL